MANKISADVLSPVGRLVQGSCFEANTTDNKGQPLVVKTGPNAGQPRTNYYIAIAIAKTDPAFNQFFAQLDAVARAGYPQFFGGDGKGQLTHPRFTYKIMDGDGVDANGASNAAKEGFAGHWIVKFSNGFAPKCYYAGRYSPQEQIQDPNAIKRGYYVRVGATVAPNIGSDVPGIYLNCNLVELVGTGDEITSGPSAADVFGQAAPAALPPGATALPANASVGFSAGQPATPFSAPSTPFAPPAQPAVPMAAPPAMGAPAAPFASPPQTPMHGVVPAAAGAVPTAMMNHAPAQPMVPVAQPQTALAPPNPAFTATAIGQPPVAAAPPVQPAGPVYQMTASAGGHGREAYIAMGWTDAQLIEAGHMVRTA